MSHPHFSGMLFTHAEQFCERIGGTVAVLPNREANFWVGNMFANQDNTAAYWTGLVSSDNGESWSWMDGNKSTFSRYPQNYNLSKKSVLMFDLEGVLL